MSSLLLLLLQERKLYFMNYLYFMSVCVCVSVWIGSTIYWLSTMLLLLILLQQNLLLLWLHVSLGISCINNLQYNFIRTPPPWLWALVVYQKIIARRMYLFVTDGRFQHQFPILINLTTVGVCCCCFCSRPSSLSPSLLWHLLCL